MTGRASCVAAVDLEVVQHHMDARRLRIFFQQLPKQQDEQVAGFAFSFDPSESPGKGVQCAGQVSFLVLLPGVTTVFWSPGSSPARSWDSDEYPPRQRTRRPRGERPCVTSLRISRKRRSRRAFGQGQPTIGFGRPNRTRCRLSNRQIVVVLTRVPVRSLNTQSQQFLRPRRPRVTIISWRAGHGDQQFPFVAVADFVVAIVLAAVGHSGRTLLDKTLGNSVHLRCPRPSPLLRSLVGDFPCTRPTIILQRQRRTHRTSHDPHAFASSAARVLKAVSKPASTCS